MIVKSSFRRAGGLEAHIMRSCTNEAVRVRLSLFRGADDLHSALLLMAGIARTNPRAKRAFVHVVISPDHALTEDELVRTLAMVEREHGIAVDAPRAVVEHEKGARPSHFHAVYSIVDLSTGKAIQSDDNFARDELISRQLELAFGERVVPGPRIEANVAELRRRGLDAEAERLAHHAPVRQEDGLSRRDRRQADRLGVAGPEWSRAAFEFFAACDSDLTAFARALEGSGYAVARGDRALLLVDDATGYHTSLVRLLRRETKAAGRPLQLTEDDVAAAFPAAPLFDRARDVGLERARTKAERAVEAEHRTAAFEALADGDTAEIEAFRLRHRRQREEDEARAQAQFRATLKARRDAIVALYRERDAARRRRVDRAFRAAGLFATPGMRRLAFGLAAAGVLMTGAGLAAALAGGLYAAHLVPSRARARRIAAAAQRDRRTDAAARRAAMDDAYRRTRDEQRSATARVRFSFDMIGRQDRVLAGFYADERLRGAPDGTGPSPAARAAADALGPEVAAGLARVLERGSPLQVRRVLHWYRGVDPNRRDDVLAAALRRHARDGRSPDAGAIPAAPASDGPSVRRVQGPTVAKPKREPRRPKPTRGPGRER